MDDKIKFILDSVINQPDSVDKMTQDEALNLRNKTNVYGIVRTGDPSYINISITNFRDTYLRRFHMVSLVGWLMRMFEEYKFEPTEDQLRELAAVDMKTADSMRKKMEAEHEAELPAVRKFLYRHFNYDPDRHVKQSYTENKEDPTRVKRYDAFLENMRVARDAPKITKELTQKQLAQDTVELYEAARNSLNAVNSTLALLREALGMGPDDINDVITPIIKQRNELMAQCKKLAARAKPISAEDTTHALITNLPADVYHHWDRYITNHYEDLREATNVLYAEKPDIEFALQYMDHFATEAEADAHRKKYESVFITPVFTLPNGGWTLLGPFKQNRDRIDFYNKETAILKEMMKQAEADNKLGAELLKKKVTTQKKRNVIEHGPDDPGLASYTSASSTIEALGAKSMLTNEERSKLADAVRTKESFEVPEGTVQVDVFHPDPKTGFKRSTFYTEADKPDLNKQHELVMSGAADGIKGPSSTVKK